MSLFKKLLQKNIARKAIRTPSFLDRDRIPPPNQQPITRPLPIQVLPGIESPIVEMNGFDILLCTSRALHYLCFEFSLVRLCVEMSKGSLFFPSF